MRFLSLFSGIGGMDLGLERAGMTCVGQCEIDPFCQRVLAKHWPEVLCWHDIRARYHQEGEADVIAAGFPCQDISSSGLRAGIAAGEHSGLWREVVRAICVVRPFRALLENVAALLNRDMGTVLGDLAEGGYDAEWDCLPACAVGAPHCRLRVFIVAHPQRDEQSRSESCLRPTGRVGRPQQSVPWDRSWQSALCEFRGMDDGTTYGVDRLDGIRNAVVPQVAEYVGRLIMEAE